MEYQNIDEATRKAACEQIKRIVKAIKAIRIKYYLIFSKISAKDKETYQKLEAKLEKIAGMHDLNNLKVALMQEIAAKYDDKPINGGTDNELKPDEILQACYGAIDAQKEALSRGRITQAIKCQERLQQYMQDIDLEQYRELIINYKREKFAELMRSRDEIENKNAEWHKIMRAFYEEGHVMDMDHVVKLITNTSKGKRENRINNKLDGEITFV